MIYLYSRKYVDLTYVNVISENIYHDQKLDYYGA